MELKDVVKVAGVVLGLHVVRRSCIGAASVDDEFELLSDLDIETDGVYLCVI